MRTLAGIVAVSFVLGLLLGGAITASVDEPGVGERRAGLVRLGGSPVTADPSVCEAGTSSAIKLRDGRVRETVSCVYRP